ncbi:MAG: hypothetical protein OEV74_07105 [Cyclobacteriaceae bacterium]|nr:hypothetical protein [Cyclobacteriaceae bacterium]MDH4296028.1 hypothetical protein [Cyclobacteriaceae bacterium]MDH5250619.1 hypothetical protein [Cyclobacteriaceae bacterium]
MYYESNHYASLWSKYRPVILHLMIAANVDPQQYKLSAHEFKAIGQREKTGFSFLLEASGGRALNNIKGSNVARDLLRVLQQSQKASQLMSEGVYELKMDKQFVLHVTRKEEVVVEPEEVVPATE